MSFIRSFSCYKGSLGTSFIPTYSKLNSNYIWTNLTSFFLLMPHIDHFYCVSQKNMFYLVRVIPELFSLGEVPPNPGSNQVYDRGLYGKCKVE